MGRGNVRYADEVEVRLQGGIPRPAVAAAERKIAALARYTAEPFLQARVRLTRVADPAVTRPVIAQGNLDVNGRKVRAQVAARTAWEAIDLLQARLRQRLMRLARHRGAQRAVPPRPEPGQWRHGQLVDRPAHRLRPVEERRVLQHKTYAPTRVTPDEAAYDMELLDYDFYLFTDADTGQDAVIYRAPPSGYRLAELVPPPATWPAAAVPLTRSQQPAARLTLTEATERLHLAGMPFLFYADALTGRGHVLYRRFDGHYGLITPE